MSEIFDFLKKTEAERKNRNSPSTPIVNEPAKEPEAFQGEVPAINPTGENSVPLQAEICADEQFDLTDASLQIKNVLDPLTLVGEQFRMLRSRLGLMQKQRGIKTILVTSTVPDEGKTFTASGLVGVFAQEPEKRVLLIDADMRKGQSGFTFGLNGSGVRIGLSEVLRGTIHFQNALLSSSNPEFRFLPSGPLPPNPSELLSSPVLEQTLKTAADAFDLVIVDSPPVISLSDATLLAPLCDAVVLVVRANRTPSKLVEEAIDRIGRDRICGVVLNRQKQNHTSRYYYQYYYSKTKS